MALISVNELAILIVEPSHFQQKFIRSELEQLGCQQIDEADTIESAMEFMSSYAPDLVISAMYLPDGDGIELVGKMRTNTKLDGIPYMLISSEQRVDVLDPIRQAGSVAILPKPFKASDLDNALHATLEFVDPSELELEDYEAEELKILVVDDSEFSLKHISRILENIGIGEVVRAHNGQEAIEMMEQTAFDLIFTDYNMPEMNGEQLTQFIRKESNQPYVPILLVTSEENESRLTGVRQAGVNAVCNKPFDSLQLKALIKSLLSH